MGAVMIDFGADGGLVSRVPEVEPAVAGRDRTGAGGGGDEREERVMAAEKPDADQSKRVSQRLKTGLGDDIFTSWFARMEFEEADGRRSIFPSRRRS